MEFTLLGSLRGVKIVVLTIITLTRSSLTLPTRSWIRGTVQPLNSADISVKAKNFFKDYGYVAAVPTSPPLQLHPSEPFTNQPLSSTSGIPPPPTTGTIQSDGDNSLEFSEAIRSFQGRFHLPITGLMDRATSELINKPRCGVADTPSRPDGLVKIDRQLQTRRNHETPQSSGSDNIINYLFDTTTESEISANTIPEYGAMVTDPLKLTAVRGKFNDEDAYFKFDSIIEEVQYSSEESWHKDADPLTHEEAVITDGEYHSTETFDSEDTAANFRTEFVTDIMTTIIYDLIYEDTVSIKSTFHPIESNHITASSTPRPSVPSPTLKILSGLSPGSQPKRRSVSSASSIQGRAEAGLTSRLTSSVIKWRLLSVYCSRHFASCDESRELLNLAFRRWAEVTPLTFQEQRTGDVLDVHIRIAFLTRDSAIDFDVSLHEDEYARYQETPGGIYLFFQDDVNWTHQSSNGYNLVSVAVHEIGHILGLSHNETSGSTMYPFYTGRSTIDPTSRQLVQNHYGTCTGSFDAAFDWVRTNNGRRVYSSYFFRDRWAWLYDNNKHRPRHGDPRRINIIFQGAPTYVDVVLQVRPNRREVNPALDRVRNHLYVFKGTRYWRLNHNDGSLYESDPDTGVIYGNGGRLIRDGWPALSGDSEPIPDNLDAAYFDQRDNNIYFFKDSQVYAYDVENNGCCAPGYPKPIREAYPGHSSSIDPLPNNIDVAYYSIVNRALFFFKGDYYWENRTYNPAANSVINKVGSKAKWNTKWEDICDVV